MEDAKIELHQNAWDELPNLPAAAELSDMAAFADGGTICVRGRLPANTEFEVFLSPDSTFYAYSGRPGRLSYSESAKPRGPRRIYEIVARSDLEGQILELLKSAKCHTVDVQRF